jgi:hypothetical protein
MHMLLIFAFYSPRITLVSLPHSQLSSPPSCTASALHRDLNARATLYANKHTLLHDFTCGRHPSVIFGEDEMGRHGNFHPLSYRAILADPAWRARLGKAHTASRRALPRADWHWRELDCAASSDALLMNIFCHPNLYQTSHAGALLGISPGTRPSFGVHPRLPRERNLIDMTEVDMELDGLLVEAKLTESDFQSAPPALLARFSNYRDVFDLEALPRTATGAYAGYQLLRGVLAAHGAGAGFCVLLDARRTDLIAAWHNVLCAVGSAALRTRLKLLTWQELSAVCPNDLQHFLSEKYGIAPV